MQSERTGRYYGVTLVIDNDMRVKKVECKRRRTSNPHNLKSVNHACVDCHAGEGLYSPYPDACISMQ